MYGCIIGRSGEEVYLLLEGDFKTLADNAKELSDSLGRLELKLIPIRKERLDRIRNRKELLLEVYDKGYI